MQEPMDWSELALDVDTREGPTYGTMWVNAPLMDPEALYDDPEVAVAEAARKLGFR